jgi:hypothetical protein
MFITVYYQVQKHNDATFLFFTDLQQYSWRITLKMLENNTKLYINSKENYYFS